MQCPPRVSCPVMSWFLLTQTTGRCRMHPSDIIDPPQLLSGDQNLGQPLQLCSLLLHGGPDPLHLPAETQSSVAPHTNFCLDLGGKAKCAQAVTTKSEKLKEFILITF